MDKQLSGAERRAGCPEEKCCMRPSVYEERHASVVVHNVDQHPGGDGVDTFTEN
jgi:hypothetical protein